MFRWLFKKRDVDETDRVPVDKVRYALMGENNVRQSRVMVPVDRATWETKYDALVDAHVDETETNLPDIVYYRPDGSDEVWLVLKPA